jgi:hypothetical protein
MDGAQISQELRDTILGGKCIAFIGSGLSSGCYDGWTDLVNGLCQACGSGYRVTAESPAQHLLDGAQAAKDRNRGAYFKYLADHFGRPASFASLTYDIVLSLPFKCYLTVNFDPLLALKARMVPRSRDLRPRAYPALDRGDMPGGSIHYLHGLIEENKEVVDGSIVLARDEFTEAYDDGSALTHMLVRTFENDPVVFIGCLLREPAMLRVFDICKRNQKKRIEISLKKGNPPGTPPQRFIFLPRFEVKTEPGMDQNAATDRRVAEEESRYRSMEINPHWYSAAERDHSSLRYILESLAGLRNISPQYGWE